MTAFEIPAGPDWLVPGLASLAQQVAGGSDDAAHQPGSKEPFKNPSPRQITKQLELARSRMTDARYAFLFNPGEGYSPNLQGQIESDLDSLVASWVEPLRS